MTTSSFDINLRYPRSFIHLHHTTSLHRILRSTLGYAQVQSTSLLFYGKLRLNNILEIRR